jgi:VIT1/CCC1 family predicted Fe2+/Mn2+ transporter
MGNDEDTGTGAGDYVKSLVFGGLDGIITTFAIVATVAGARAHPGLVLLMGAANLVADALSMGIGDYLSERAEDEYVASEQRRELAELRNGKRPEKVRKLKRVYEKAGLSTTDAKKCVDALSTVDDVLVAHTMMARLQLVPPDDWLGEEQDEDEDELLSLAAKKGATTAASFVLFGAMPLLAYYATVATSVAPTPERMFIASCLVTTSTLVALGSAKARLTAQPVAESALGMVINGGAAAVAAYAVGHALEAFQHATSMEGFDAAEAPAPLQLPVCFAVSPLRCLRFRGGAGRLHVRVSGRGDTPSPRRRRGGTRRQRRERAMTPSTRHDAPRRRRPGSRARFRHHQSTPRWRPPMF